MNWFGLLIGITTLFVIGLGFFLGHPWRALFRTVVVAIRDGNRKLNHSGIAFCAIQLGLSNNGGFGSFIVLGVY